MVLFRTGRRVGAAAGIAILAVLGAVAGCAPPDTVVVDGAAGPLTGPPPNSPTGSPTGSPAVPAPATGAASGSAAGPSGSARPPPVVPTEFVRYRLAGDGRAASLPVPAGWDVRGESPDGSVAQFWDPTEQVLLRLHVSAATGESARERMLAGEPEVARRLPGYRRVVLAAVGTGYDSAADWSYAFDDAAGGRRQVLVRAFVAGATHVSVYYSARVEHYPLLRPVWDRAVAGLRVA